MTNLLEKKILDRAIAATPVEADHAKAWQEARQRWDEKVSILEDGNQRLSDELETERNELEAIERKREQIRDVGKRLNDKKTKLKDDLELARFRLMDLESDIERMKEKAGTSNTRITELNDDNAERELINSTSGWSRESIVTKHHSALLEHLNL